MCGVDHIGLGAGRLYLDIAGLIRFSSLSISSQYGNEADGGDDVLLFPDPR